MSLLCVWTSGLNEIEIRNSSFQYNYILFPFEILAAAKISILAHSVGKLHSSLLVRILPLCSPLRRCCSNCFSADLFIFESKIYIYFGCKSFPTSFKDLIPFVLSTRPLRKQVPAQLQSFFGIDMTMPMKLISMSSIN